MILDLVTDDPQWSGWSAGALSRAANESTLAINPLIFAEVSIRGERRAPLADFYIGAHAAVRGLRLLTRDPRRYRTYFPTVALVAP